MKALILQFIIWIISPAFSQQDTWYSQNSKALNSFLHQMQFRQPIVFTPFEVKVGYLNYGGKDYWSGVPFNSNLITTTDLPVLLDSTQYQFNIIDALKNRTGIFIEADLLKTNLPHFIIHQNYIDLQFGLGFQYTDFSSNPSLPSIAGKEWNVTSNRGNYYFHPKTIGVNINTSLGWQIARNRATYLYYSFGINSLSLYESEGGNQSLTGTGMTESFGIGTKYIINQHQNNFSYTFGIEAKWSRLYISSVEAPEDFSPIHGIDLRASGIFLTTGIQFGGKQTDGDIAYSFMINNDFISAAENFEYFLANEIRHGKREKALKMLQYCQSQIPYQQVNYGVEEVFETNYYEAVQWFDDAEAKANDELKIEIRTQRVNIANEIIDSVQNYKNKMSIEKAEQLIMIAVELMPDNKRSDQILSGLYHDKGILNTDIGNYSEAIENYLHAVELYPPIESVVLRDLDRLINTIIKDAFISAQAEELHLVIGSLETIIKLKPERASEWDHYMEILETQLNYQKNDSKNSFKRDYIKTRQQETVSDNSYILQLGMTYKEVERIRGTPEIIDEMNDANQYFQMWTYGSESKPTRLYFEANKLIRIEK